MRTHSFPYPSVALQTSICSWVSGRGGLRSSTHLCAATSPGLLPPRSRFAACHHHFGLREASNTWGTFYKYYTEHGANYTWSSPIYWCLHSPRVLRWMEKRWLSGALKAPGQATAEDALGCSVSWESKNSQNMKNMPPSAGGDQPTHPAAKHSLCTGKPSGNSSVLLPPVNQNWLWCLKEWSQTYHLSKMPHKPSDWKLSFILMKATLRKGRVITTFPSVKCPKGGTWGNPSERHCDGFKCFQSKKALRTEWLQQNFAACSEKKPIK